MAKLKINRGTTYTIEVNYQRNSVAASLVGATVRFTVKTAEYDSDTDDSDASIIKNVTTGTSGGVATITLDPDDTATLAPGKYYYDIKVDEDSDGVTVYKIDEGTIVLDASPTNRLA
jgi:uncharacterized membrane protein YkoI